MIDIVRSPSAYLISRIKRPLDENIYREVFFIEINCKNVRRVPLMIINASFKF